MHVSEKLEQAKFSKSVAGYSVKEVEGFLADLLLLVRDEEERVRALSVKLSAFEAQAAEIEKREQESLRLLEAARAEAEGVRIAAQRNADAIVAEAKAVAEAREHAAKVHADEQIKEAERRSAARVEEAKQNAEMILVAADRKGRTMLAESKSRATAESQNARALAAECAAFEARFRALAADTVRALAALKEEAPKPIVTVSEPAPIAAEPVQKATRKEQAAEKVAEKASAPEKEEPKAPVVQDVPFAGGQPVSAYTKETDRVSSRKLYDTVTVTYEEDDGFSDIRKLMGDTQGKKQTNPAHFME